MDNFNASKVKLQYFRRVKIFIKLLGQMPNDSFQDNLITECLMHTLQLFFPNHFLIDSRIHHISYLFIDALCHSSLKH